MSTPCRARVPRARDRPDGLNGATRAGRVEHAPALDSGVVRACTIVARNYLAHARVLADSFLEHHPEGRVDVLVLDDVDYEGSASAEPFSITSPYEIGLERAEFHRMAMMYTTSSSRPPSSRGF